MRRCKSILYIAVVGMLCVVGCVKDREKGCSCLISLCSDVFFFFFQAEDGIRDLTVTGVQTCALPIFFKYYTAEAAKLTLEHCSRKWSTPLCFNDPFDNQFDLHFEDPSEQLAQRDRKSVV